MISDVIDNGGRRMGFERRQFTYNEHIPERRSGRDRRSRIDRRASAGVKCENERRAVFMGNFVLND